jgi:hypothetical protein
VDGEVAVPALEEPWTRRVAAWTRAFADGLDLRERIASVGGAVRDHLGPARWAGIALGALVLLFWPAPTLSVLIWIVALVALYVGALEWLANRAPERATEAAPATPAPVVPARRPAVPGVVGDGGPNAPPDGSAAEPAAAVPSRRTPVPEPRAPEPLVPAGLTPETISTLNDRLALLVRLGAAHDSGVLTDDEFRREKDRLLGV